ncbi:MAG: FAD/NAD(P)-binding protein [Methylacidiphilales bacterium]|nr:FAD/NAD(P)-binding protein [Candidatus Methylacidiphilales bacterium]
MDKIAIIGAGFCGVALCYSLRKKFPNSSITIYSRSSLIGSGVAYGTNSPFHLLNVPAGRMGMIDGQENDFYLWLCEQGYTYHPEDFVPRKLYGEYLRSYFVKTPSLTVVRSNVIAIQTNHESAHIVTDKDDMHQVDLAILALGNFPSKIPQGITNLPWESSSNCISDPWHPASQANKLLTISPSANVLLIGSGLTALDIASLLLDKGIKSIVAMSRNGVLPQPHRGLHVIPEVAVSCDSIIRQSSLRLKLHQFRMTLSQVRNNGGDWRDLFIELRKITPELWQSLSIVEQSKFLKKIAPFWETHRHRISPQLHAKITEAIKNKLVTFYKANCISATMINGVIQVSTSSKKIPTIRADCIINCTGPNVDITKEKDPLIEQLVKQGTIIPDSHNLGLQVTNTYRTVNSRGEVNKNLLYLGPLLKAKYYEATAVPELRAHVKQLVSLL